MKETRRENCWTEEAKENGATDQFEASVLTLVPKLLSDVVQGVLEVTAGGTDKQTGKDRQTDR